MFDVFSRKIRGGVALAFNKWRRFLSVLFGRNGIRGLVLVGLGLAILVMFIHIVLSIAILALVGAAWLMLSGKAGPSSGVTVRLNPRHPVAGPLLRARHRIMSLFRK